MIVGLGIDITECDRLRKAIERHGDAFIDYFCTAEEQASAPKAPAARIAFFAGRWAAKEACSKALGTGIGQDCAFHDIHISNSDEGRPAIVLTGHAKITAERLNASVFHLSISHERHAAVACVIAESVEK